MKPAKQNSPITVLVVDDDEAVRDSLSGYLQSMGWNTLTAESAVKALDQVRKVPPDVVITDVRMPRTDGIELTRRLKEIDPDLEVIIATGHSTEALAIDAIRAGAFDYFHKPVDAQEVTASLQRLQRFNEMKRANRRLQAVVSHYAKIDPARQWVAESATAKVTLRQLEQIARSPATTILLTGESGAGKEVAARLIHQWSKAPGTPFIPVNCGAIPETLLESELFGREKGAYTGADKTSPGVFEMALGGTVLLDEIGEMSMSAQSRFLRVIEEKRFRRVGGVKEIAIDDTRIIAATNRNLEEMVKAGQFRQDLYFRIAVAPVHLPPLRERREDVLPLASHFLRDLNGHGARQVAFAPAAIQALTKHDFPGNCRELRNRIERALIFATDGEITPADLGLVNPEPTAAANAKGNSPEVSADTLGFNLANHEIDLIRKALQLAANNHTAAARALGISPQALYRKLEKYKIK